MANAWFQFKQFTIHQDRCAMKVTTDACLFGGWVAEQVAKDKDIKTILDVGAGTGLLSLMLAQKSPAAITAIEIDEEAFKQACENVNASSWKNRINILHQDAKAFVPSGRFDCVVSNPPFYENEWLSTDKQKNLAHHGTDLLLHDFFLLLPNVLHGAGRFFLLLPYKRHRQLMTYFEQQKVVISRICYVRQSPQHDVFRFMIEGRLNGKASTEISELSIKGGDGNYTRGFTSLLKDYYLYL